jgi:hypothetical protein
LKIFPIQKRNNWWCRYGCSYAPGIKGQAYQGSSSSFIAYNNVANPLIAIKALLFLCGLKQTTYRRSTIFIYVTKTTDFWGNIFTLVEGTGPATTMLMKITFKRRNT